MRFVGHDQQLRGLAPALVVGLISVDGITGGTDEVTLTGIVQRDLSVARRRLEAGPESQFDSIRAWRQVFAQMGLRPTQYRCAAEQLLRRVRREGTLPQVHPMVDLCNAASAAAGIPVAALDRDRIAGDLVVRPAAGDEAYLTFRGEQEHPDPGEVIFADAERHAHARRWVHRQSARSAMGADTHRALIIIEAVHVDAEPEVSAILGSLADDLDRLGWTCRAREVRSGDRVWAADS